MTPPDEVLQQYLEACSNDASRLGHQLASNAVLEWNGVTIRFGAKIVKFLRQKMHTGMVQSFTDASTVEAFENRQTHTSTKTIPPENFSLSAGTSQPTAETTDPASQQSTSSPKPNSSTREDSGFETPPRTLPAAPHPPALIAGRQFQPLSSDDDDDDEDEDGEPSAVKRIKKSPSPADHHHRQNVYSELHYLEATGTVRTVNERKHRGTRTTHHIPRRTQPAGDGLDTTPPTPPSANPVEKSTRLKLSYRMHQHSQEIQFALIIYEDLSHRSTAVRRNLFAEETTELEQSRASGSSSPLRRQEDTTELLPLPDSPPDDGVPGGDLATLTPQPPATPFKRRRIIGMRSSPRRTTSGIDDSSLASPTSATASSGSSINETTVQQTWPRKSQHAAARSPGGASAAKSRKLSDVSTTIRKPLRF